MPGAAEVLRFRPSHVHCGFGRSIPVGEADGWYAAFNSSSILCEEPLEVLCRLSSQEGLTQQGGAAICTQSNGGQGQGDSEAVITADAHVHMAKQQRPGESSPTAASLHAAGTGVQVKRENMDTPSAVEIKIGV